MLTDRERVDLLDNRADVGDDHAAACDLLWAFVQADSACELEHTRKCARAYLLVNG